MHDFGGIVWIILVVIGVITSISKNAKKARGQRPRGRPQPPQPPPAQKPAPVRNIVDVLIAGPPLVSAPRPVMPPAPVPVPAQARSGPQPSVNSLSEAEARSARSAQIGTSPIRGMFEGPATLIRAIVAAEVLGPPKSMQEQSIWSPRHSEPSI